MRCTLVPLVLVALVGPVHAEDLTPQRCQQLANQIAPILPLFDGLQASVRAADTKQIGSVSDGRLRQAADEAEVARKQFLTAAATYQMGLAFLFNELKNCQNGTALPADDN